MPQRPIPNVDDALQQMILINTAGGITSGDNYSTSIKRQSSMYLNPSS